MFIVNLTLEVRFLIEEINEDSTPDLLAFSCKKILSFFGLHLGMRPDFYCALVAQVSTKSSAAADPL